MNIYQFTINYFFTVLICIGFVSCRSGKKSALVKEETPVQIAPEQLIDGEAKQMLDYLNELGDYVNSRNFPSLIKASSVYEGMGYKQLVIDIRSADNFMKGHISGAINIEFKKLPDYFEADIVPFKYDKIILISEAGQTASYATCLLRLMGYGNVFSMRWGMSGWHKDFAGDYWYSALGSEYQNALETTNNVKAPQRKLPNLETNRSTGEEILLFQVKKLFSEGTEPAHLTAKMVFSSLEEYYIMNYIRRDKYEAGHISGAIRYKPQATLGIVAEMSTIPTDRPSIVYCGTGHNSGFVTAYLRLFGYNAKTLVYGNNSFMFDKMVAEEETLSWLPFTDKEVADYSYSKIK